MKQKTYSDIRPEKNFSIENIENGKCTVLFFDNVQEEVQENHFENEGITEKVVYSYDIYTTEVLYRDNLSETIATNFEKWLKDVKEKDYNEVAAEIRSKRNEMLKETDKEMCIDRLNLSFPEELSMTNIITALKDFFDGFADITKSNIAKYRQELRDLTKQEGFPYNIVWPTKDENKED